MNIVGEKVVLRALCEADAPVLHQIINDFDTERMLGGKSFPVSMEAQLEWIRNQRGREDTLRCAIVEKDADNQMLGTVILSDINYKQGTAQIHIKMGSGAVRRKGFGYDALKTMVTYAFNELRLHCVYAEVLEYNKPSQALFEKCGFQKDGILRARAFKGGCYVNVIAYSVMVEEVR